MNWWLIKKRRAAQSGVAATASLVANPNVELGDTEPTSWFYSASTEWVTGSNRALRINVTGATADWRTAVYPVEAGATYDCGMWVKGAADNVTVLAVRWFSDEAGTAYIGETWIPLEGANADWTKHSQHLVAPVGAVSGDLMFRAAFATTVDVLGDAFFVRKLNSYLVGATWATDGNGRGYNTPLLGSNLFSNGDFASATGWVTGAGWSIGGGKAVLTNNAGTMYQSGLTANVWYQQDVTVESQSDGIGLRIGSASNIYTIPDGTGARYATGRADTAQAGAKGITSISNAQLDDMIIKPITLPTVFAHTQGSATSTPAARIFGIGIAQSGTIGWLDDPLNPQNFILAIRNGAGNVNLTKCVAGVYTVLASVAVAFVANAVIEIRRPSGNTFQLFYDGVQVGTNQTINDTAIADNIEPYFGAFSTHSENKISQFTLSGTSYLFPGS